MHAIQKFVCYIPSDASKRVQILQLAFFLQQPVVDSAWSPISGGKRLNKKINEEIFKIDF